LLLIVSLRSVDLPLQEIRRRLAEPAGASRDAMVAKLLEDHRGRLQARLTRLQRPAPTRAPEGTNTHGQQHEF
jgi:DNA-binding transcriptional MerR regulator